jgi:hypothetical protein
MKYAVHQIDGQGISFGTKIKSGATIQFEVRHVDGGPRAFATGCFMLDGLSKQKLAGMRRSAASQCEAYERYLERTGNRWEVLQKEKADAAAAIKKRDARIEQLTKRIPELEAELEQLRGEKSMAEMVRLGKVPA